MHTQILGLRTCAYLVSDLQKAKEWYTNAFGTEPYFDEPFYVGFNIGGYELGLLPQENPPESKPDSVLTYWGVNDIQGVYQNLLEIGAKSHEEPTNYGGELMIASVKDPWDNVVGLVYNPDFKLKSD
jgi:predicted enzyme related to lactoylglutathione lyase